MARSIGQNHGMRGITLGAAIATLLLQVSDVHAQSQTCVNLQNQLSALNSVNANNVGNQRFRQYDRAVREQRAQIQKTQRMAQRNGCTNALFNRRNTSTCGRITTSLEQMRTNLASLERERRRLAPRNNGVQSDRQRSLIRAMNRRGCFTNNNLVHARLEQPRRRSLIEQIFGVRTFSEYGRRNHFDRPDVGFASRYGTYRTMCVREEDGYYFPISFSTTPDRFEFDEQVCESKCPGNNVSLYYHEMPAQDSEDMIAYRGQTPYADLPNAFAYRKKYNPKVTCNFSAGITEEIPGYYNPNRSDDDPSKVGNQVVGTPVFRIDRAQDPESLANLDGNFAEKDAVKLLSPVENNSDSQVIALNGRKVRVVGPKFFQN